MKALIIYPTNGSEPSHSEAVQTAFVSGGGVSSDLYNISSFNQTVINYAKDNDYDAIIFSYSGEESYFSLAESNPDVMIFMPSDNYNGDLQQLVLTSNFYNVNVFENNDFRDWTLELGMSATQTTLTNGYSGVNFAHVSNCLEVGKRYRLKLIVSNNSNYADSRIVGSPFGTEIVAITKNTTTDTLVDFVATTTDLYVEMPYTGTLTFTAFELIADSREFTDYTQSALSYANGYICGQLFYIAEQRNCTLQESRICANATKDEDGIIDVDLAIAYSGTIALTVGTLTAVRGIGFSSVITLERIIDATNYKIEVRKLRSYYTEEIETTDLINPYTLPSYGHFKFRYMGYNGSLESAWSSWQEIKYNSFDKLGQR